MERIVNVAKNQKEARQWDIQQALEMTPEERRKASRILRERAYGSEVPDVREAERDRIKKRSNKES